MKVHKDHQHSVTLHPFAWQGKRRLMVCVGLYAALDPEGGACRLRTEQDFWKEAPAVFAALGQPPLLDLCLPKPGAEVLVAGCCRAPGHSLVPAQEVTLRVGDWKRRIAVFGDRERLPGGGVSEPVPFNAMPLVWERAFGGPDNPANPVGKGLDAEGKPSRALPNLEDPAQLLLLASDQPLPVCPFPVSLDNPARRALSGTYDQHWLDTRWPAYPDDCDPDFFHSAQKAQRLASFSGAPVFFQGGEPLEITGMHHEYPRISSRLPDVRLRAFVTTTEGFTPFAQPTPEQTAGPGPRLPYAKDLDAPGLFQEVTLRCDTVWLLPDLLGAFVLYRGLLPVTDDEMDDVLRVLVVTEQPANVPYSLEHYRDELKKRAWPAVEIDLAPFVAAQAQVTKAVKHARDVPKTLAAIKKDMLGQSPTMPLSLGDMAHSAGQTLATGRTTLNQLEQQMLAQREQFSHLVSFDLSVFPQMRSLIDEQEKALDQALRQAGDELRTMDARFKEGAAAMKAHVKQALQPVSWASAEEIATKARFANVTQAELDKLDAFSAEGILCEPPQLNPWHDRGFPLVIAARRALRRNDRLLAHLTTLGFEPQTLDKAWIGHAPDEVIDSPERWGLPPLPDGASCHLPAGLYVPLFDGKALAALHVYPLPDPQALPRGLGADNAAIALAAGSNEQPLSLPAAQPGGAVVAAPEVLSALFAEQEAGDFCHLVAAADPAALAAAADLPPLLPEVALADGGLADRRLPLVVILPPLPDGAPCFAPWQAAYPAAIPLYLPENCPHVLALAAQGHRLRRLLLDVLPADTTKVHDLDLPLPPADKPMAPFTLNLPLPTKDELSGQITSLISELRAHFPDPETLLAEMIAQQKLSVLGGLRKNNAPPEMLAKVVAAFENPPNVPPAQTVAELTRRNLDALETMRQSISATAPPDVQATLRAALDKATQDVHELGAKLAPLDTLREESLATLAACEKGELPKEVKAAFDAQGMDPNAMKALTREEVAAILAADKNLERRNLQGLDLSGLDFSGANLSHALCGYTLFRGCRMDGVHCVFTLASEADFTGATFHDALFKQAVLHKAVLQQADFSTARLDMTTFGECDATEACFERTEISLCDFGKAVLHSARFGEAQVSLSTFAGVQATGADFDKVRAFKCLFQKSALGGASFRESTLRECLFQGVEAAGLSLVGADLRKFYTDAETNLNGADLTGADLREASLRLSRFRGAEFCNANLEQALIVQCDLAHARLDGLQATGCRFSKCDLTGADLAGTKLNTGALRKCRLSGADLGGASLYAANLCDITLDETTVFTNTQFKRTILEGKEEALRDVTRRHS